MRRSDQELLGIQNALVMQSESVDFLYKNTCDLTEEEIEYIRDLGKEAAKKYKLS
jgi:hypothetical protein